MPAVWARLKRQFVGGSEGNEQLTAIVATLLIVLLAVEGATLLNLSSLLTVHAFVGMLLIPVVALKLASTGWRMARYYLRGAEYVRRGPPHILLRVLVAPIAVASTIVLFATGVALLGLGATHGTLVGLHKASFVVWLGVMAVHVLTRLRQLPPPLRRSVPGLRLRYAVAAASLACGLAVAMLTLPAADQLQDNLTAQIGFDVG
jgi:hypothetical protein